MITLTLTPLLSISLWFIAGLFFESFILIADRVQLHRIFLPLLLAFGAYSLVAIFDQHFSLHALVFIVAYSYFFSRYLGKQALNIISEKHLLQFNLVFIYLLFSSSITANLPPLYMAALSAPIIPVIFISYSEIHLGRYRRLIAYLWFLSMVVLSLIIQTVTWLIPHVNGSSLLTPIEAVTLGMSFMTLIVNATYLLHLAQPSWYQSTLMREYLIAFFTNDQLSKRETTAILVLQGGLLVCNYFLKLLSPVLIIGLSYGLLPLVINRLDNERIRRL